MSTPNEAALKDAARAAGRFPSGARSAVLRRFPLALILTDPRQDDNPIVFVNKAFTELTGYSPEQAIGRNCRFLQGEERGQPGAAKLRRAIEAGEEATADLVNVRADGGRFVNRLMITPLHGDDGGVIHFMGIQVAIDGVMTQSEQVEELTHRLTELQHRVKNHLSLILAMIRLQAAQKTTVSAAAETLSSRVEALSLLYDQVLNPDAEPADQEVATGIYVNRVCASLQLLADDSRIIVNASTDEVSLPFEDAWRFGLYLSEVLTNALKHAFAEQERGRVDVVFEAQERALVLSVTDDGKGLGGKDFPSTDGLGGRIVGDLVTRLCGQLEVSAGKGGKGTRIVLTVPRS